MLFEELYKLPILLVTFLSRNYKQMLKSFYRKILKRYKACIKEKLFFIRLFQNCSLRKYVFIIIILKIASSKDIFEIVFLKKAFSKNTSSK